MEPTEERIEAMRKMLLLLPPLLPDRKEEVEKFFDLFVGSFGCLDEALEFLRMRRNIESFRETHED